MIDGKLERGVEEVRAQLVRKGKGVHAEKVLITSDGKDQGRWDAVAELGYTWIDHKAARTEELYGECYGPMLDAIFHSLAAGFVGTDQSTMSLPGGTEGRGVDWRADGVFEVDAYGSGGAVAHGFLQPGFDLLTRMVLPLDATRTRTD